MIFDTIIELFLAVLQGLLRRPLASLPSPPGWFLTGMEGVRTITGWLYSLDHWLPIDLALGVAAGVAATWVLASIIQLVRTIVSYLTLGGGAT